MKWGSIISLIGGFTVAGYQVTNQKPDVILSQPAFASNDSHCLNYFDMEMVDYTKEVYDKHLDFVVAVPPCSALSSLNCKSCADYESVNFLYDTSHYVLKNIKPTVLVGENAPGLSQPKGIPVKQKLMEIAEEFGYSFSMFFTTTSLHGIPQNRQRTFYFFTKNDKAPIHKYYHNIPMPLEDYLGWIPKDATYQDVYVQKEQLTDNFFWRFLREELGPDYRQIMHDRNRRSVLSYCRRTDGAFEKLISFLEREKAPDKVLEKAKYAQQKFNAGGGLWDASPNIFINTINALQGRLFQAAVHPLQDRWYNVREYMHLMGLPHDFQLVNENYGQICQNVPVCTAADMVREATRIMAGNCDWSKGSYSFTDNTRGLQTTATLDSSSLFF